MQSPYKRTNKNQSVYVGVPQGFCRNYRYYKTSSGVLEALVVSLSSVYQAAKIDTNSSGRLQDSASAVISVIKAAGTVVAFSIAVQVFSKSV